MDELLESMFQQALEIRYVAVYVAGQLTTRERPDLAHASAPESDRYEELLVNPTLLTLVQQRGNIDCGGMRYLILQVLSTPEVTAELRDPATLADASVIRLTKMVLFPVRLLFTARTGQVGRNEAAAEYFTAVETGPAADLARNGLTWREEPPDPSDPVVLDSLEKGLLPLYRLFLDEYAVRLRQYGELDLARAFEEWRQRLE
jgi:hypothetical protein